MDTPSLFYQEQDMKPACPALYLMVPEPGILSLGMIFSAGVGLMVQTGFSLRATMIEQLKVTADYLEEKLQTIFLNNRPVDDLDGVFVAPGDILALSAAMPGLVGATLRRAGHLAAMRREITQGKTARQAATTTAMITLKLFNLACRDLGPELVKRGVLARPDQLAGLLAALKDPESKDISIVFDNKYLEIPAAIDRLERLCPTGLVELKVSARQP